MGNETKILIGVTLVTIGIIAGGVFLFSKPPEPPKPVDTAILVRSDSPQIFVDSAKPTIVEFADFQCPGCAAVDPIVNRILEDYKGKVNFVYRHFPLTGHKNAEPASKFAEAAGLQAKFWEAKSLLYEKQSEWENLDDPLPIFKTYAESLKINVPQLVTDMQMKEIKDKIARDTEDGFGARINSTPTFFINGVILSGRTPTAIPDYTDFKNALDSKL